MSNHGQEDAEDVEVKFYLNDVLQESVSTNVPAGQSINLSFKTQVTEEGFHKIEYLRVLDAETFRDYQGAGRPGRVFVAAWLGKARLIDNIAV